MSPVNDALVSDIAAMCTPVAELPDEKKAALLEAACKKTKTELKPGGCLKKGTGLKKCDVCCMQEDVERK